VSRTSGSLQYSEFKGSYTSYPELVEFVSGLLETAYKPPIPVTHDEIAAEKIAQFDVKSFNDLCIKRDNTCAIWLLDGSLDAKKSAKHVNLMKTIQIESAKKFLPYTFGAVDAVC
jgi:hypothetical protein